MSSHLNQYKHMNAEFTIKELTDKPLIDDALHIVYSAYIEELHIKCSELKDFGAKVIHPTPEENIFFDNYCYSATWFGAFENDEMIACIRCSSKFDKDHHPEIEHFLLNYDELNKKYLLEKSISISRLAVKPKHRHRHVTLLLLRACLRHALQNKKPLVGVSYHRGMSLYFERLGWPTLEKVAIKTIDHEYCNKPRMLYVSYTEGKLQSCIEIINKKIDHAASRSTYSRRTS